MDGVKSYAKLVVETINDKRYWLPEFASWEDFLPAKTPELEAAGYYRPQGVSELWPCIPLAIIFILIRRLLFKYVFTPIGTRAGVKQTRKAAAPPRNVVLEKVYQENKTDLKKSNMTQLTSLRFKGEKLDLKDCATISGLGSERKVLNWLRKKRNTDLWTPQEKFNSCAFEFCFYCPMSFYNYYCVYDQPWFQDGNVMHTHFVGAATPYKIFWQYVLCNAMYICLLASLFLEVRRRDHKIMFTHHICVLILTGLSYHAHWTPKGSMTLFAYDFVDLSLSLAKLGEYTGDNLVNLVVGLILVFSWVLGRLYYQPLYVVYPSWLAVTVGNIHCFACYLMVYFLIAVAIMQVYWSYFLFLIVYRTLTGRTQQDMKDARSESDAESDQALNSDDSTEISLDHNSNIFKRKQLDRN